MDLLLTLRNKIEVLENGDYVPGLRAVLLHIETAFRHLSRGQETDDDTAFTDAIYRTNQAFEGSIKEAYRVLAGQDPNSKRPFDIENYLVEKKTFRSRVLSQFTTYRTEWRNPSTHDYKLDFDESEAFLAIVSVSAFACLLLDQIAEHLSYLKSQAQADAQKQTLDANLSGSQDADLLSRVAIILQQFCALPRSEETAPVQQTEAQIVGALHGFFASVAPSLVVVSEARLNSARPYRADLLISEGQEKLIIELKRRLVKRLFHDSLARVEQYMRVGGIVNSILLFLPEVPGELAIKVVKRSTSEGRVAVLYSKDETFPDFELSQDWLVTGNHPTNPLTVGQNVFHQKFGKGKIVAIDGRKLDILFDEAGLKKVLDSFVQAA